MEDVRRFVTQLIRAERHGGRIIARDAQTLLLYDVSLWGDEHARAVRGRFPECDVSCMANGNSMSGFVVMIARGPCAGSAWASMFVVALLGAAYTAWALCGIHGI
jgi:hypothetical protein